MRVFNINADLYHQNYFALECKQGDDITLNINILENGVASDLTGATLSFNLVKADNTIVNVTRSNITTTGNTVTIMCPTDCTRAVGVARAELVMVQASKQTTSFDIAINVLPSVIQGQAVSQNVATIIEEIKTTNANAENTIKDLNAAIANGDIKNMQIGTRNYFLNSKTNYLNNVYNTLLPFSISDDFKINAKGNYLTISAWFEGQYVYKDNGHYGVGLKITYEDTTIQWLSLDRNYISTLENPSGTVLGKRYFATIKCDNKKIVNIDNAVMFVNNMQSVSNFIIKDIMIEVGSKASDCVEAPEDVQKQINNKANKGQNIRIVAKSNSEYTSIMDAVNAGGDTIENPITIQIFPGVYKESVYIKQWSRLNLVGTNKKDCIIRQDHGEYTSAPLETAGERYIANLTFISTHNDNPTLDISLQKNYAFHGDKNSGGDGKTLIENCRFESYQSASVGLGIYNNQIFHFRNCEFYSKIPATSPIADIGAFFAHNNVAGGVTNGQLILENCTFFMDNDNSSYGHACYINDANLTSGDGTGNPLNVKFINCTLQRKVGGHVNAIRVDNTTSINNLSGSITLDKTSNGNNIGMINFPQIMWYYPTLPTGVTNVGSSFTHLRYCKDNNGNIKVEATLAGLASGVSTKLFTLPVGYRPLYHRFYDLVNYSGSTLQIGKILVNRNGDVSVEGTLNSTRCDINFEFYAEQ